MGDSVIKFNQQTHVWTLLFFSRRDSKFPWIWVFWTSLCIRVCLHIHRARFDDLHWDRGRLSEQWSKQNWKFTFREEKERELNASSVATSKSFDSFIARDLQIFCCVTFRFMLHVLLASIDFVRLFFILYDGMIFVWISFSHTELPGILMIYRHFTHSECVDGWAQTSSSSIHAWDICIMTLASKKLYVQKIQFTSDV